MTSICTLPAGASILVTRGAQTTQFFAGVAVDLGAIAVEATGGRPAETWADVLGAHVAHFALDEAPPAAGSFVATLSGETPTSADDDDREPSIF